MECNKVDKVVVWILLLYYWSVSLLVSSWITGVALHSWDEATEERMETEDKRWESAGNPRMLCTSFAATSYLSSTLPCTESNRSNSISFETRWFKRRFDVRWSTSYIRAKRKPLIVWKIWKISKFSNGHRSTRGKILRYQVRYQAWPRRKGLYGIIIGLYRVLNKGLRSVCIRGGNRNRLYRNRGWNIGNEYVKRMSG